MATYFIFETVTREGKMTIAEAPARSEGVESAAAGFGVRLVEWFFTTGTVDFVMQVEAEDETDVAAFAMTIQRSGNVGVQWCRAYRPDEWKAIVAKLP